MNLVPSDMSLRVVFDDEDDLVIIDDIKNCDNILLRINEIKGKYYNNNENIKITLTFTDDNKYYQIILSRNTNNKSI